jgi:hypothetical protein
MPLRPRHAYAADFRRGLPAGHINRPGSHPTPPGASGVHRNPAHIRQVGAGGILERRSTPVPHVHRPVLLAGPRPSGSAGPSRRCRGCLPPSPASPGSGCPQLQPPCCDKAAAKVSHLHSIPQRLVALDVVVPVHPAAPLEVVQPKGPLRLPVILLHSPARLGQPHQLHDRRRLGRFDSQYLVGSALPTGHSTSSQRSGSSPPSRRASRRGGDPGRAHLQRQEAAMLQRLARAARSAPRKPAAQLGGRTGPASMGGRGSAAGDGAPA